MCYDLHPHCHRTCKNSASEGEEPCAEKKKNGSFSPECSPTCQFFVRLYLKLCFIFILWLIWDPQSY